MHTTSLVLSLNIATTSNSEALHVHCIRTTNLIESHNCVHVCEASVDNACYMIVEIDAGLMKALAQEATADDRFPS